MSYIPYLPKIFGQIKIIIFFTVRTFNLEKNYNFFSVRIFTNAEKLPIIKGIHRYICGTFSAHTDRCENKQFCLTLHCFIKKRMCEINLDNGHWYCFFNCGRARKIKSLLR